eukprot:s4275_g1.t1
MLLQCRFAAQKCLIGPMAVPMGEAAKVVFFEGFRRVEISFRVARVGLRDISNVLDDISKAVLYGRRNIAASFSKDEFHVSWRRITLETSIVIFLARSSRVYFIELGLAVRDAGLALRGIPTCEM